MAQTLSIHVGDQRGFSAPKLSDVTDPVLRNPCFPGRSSLY